MTTGRTIALVTGAAGFVGDRVAKRLLHEGLSVRTLDQRPVDLAGATSYQADVTDAVAVQRATAEAALIVHCAAVIAGTPAEMARVNAGAKHSRSSPHVDMVRATRAANGQGRFRFGSFP